ncbi:MAG: 3-dehydroquinate synthase [Acutalibacteraceae bacterium]
MIIPVNLGKNSYDIVLERGALLKVGKLFPVKGKVLVVTDSGVPEAYSKAVASQFKESFIFTFPQGEENKNFDTYMSICGELLSRGFNRKDVVIAVGGGVCGDMAGFAAATYMRGIDFYNIPTTLLSQVDSSIGGKTAIDFRGVKNIIGAFYQPKMVVIDPYVLRTLSDRLISCGLAESLKMAMCFDRELYEIFKKDKLSDDDIDAIIESSLKIKKKVVEQDEKESGLRKSLNFGHTIGHGIEGAVGLGELYHGECVALGMLYMCSEKIKNELFDIYRKLGLPFEYNFDKEKVREIISHDKKSLSGGIDVVICDEIGSFRFEKLSVDEIMNKI